MKSLVVKLLLLISICGVCVQSVSAEKSLTAADLKELDDVLKHASWYEGLRYNKIDSLRLKYNSSITDIDKYEYAMILGKEFISFKADSAYMYLNIAKDLAETENDYNRQLDARIALIKPLGILGLYNEAVRDVSLLEQLDIQKEQRIELYDGARQLYSHMMENAAWGEQYSKTYYNKNREYRDSLLTLINADSYLYRIYHAEQYVDNGDINLAIDMLQRLIADLKEDAPEYALAMWKLANIKEKYSTQDEAAHYLVLSAITYTKCAIKDNESLSQLAKYLYEKGDVERAYRYLDASLYDANFCNARFRYLQIAEDMPIISQSYRHKTQQQNSLVTRLLVITVTLLVVILIIGLLLAWQFTKQRGYNKQLKNMYRMKEQYIGQFIELCSIYMERLDSFTKIVGRKVSTGQTEDLRKMIKSPKFSEEQNKIFFETFDSGFLHLYPNFVEELNKLLRPEERIVIKTPNTLTMELRIFAFLRLGVEDANKIAHFLHFSVNTIYTYRNKIRNKAIDRNSFDDDVMEIGNINL